MRFDPFGDFEQNGYLRNIYGEKDLNIVKDLENSTFKLNIDEAVRDLSTKPINYETFKQTHERLFGMLYPWAGQDRSITAPNIAITKGGYETLFAHPGSVQMAAEYAFRDMIGVTNPTGTCFARLAYAHPFLDGNGRTILTLHSEILRRKEQHVEWEKTDKVEFLTALTNDLENPDQGHFEAYLNPYIKDNALSLDDIGTRLKAFLE